MKRNYLFCLLAVLFIVAIPTACTDDSESSAEDLAKKFCDCNKIKDVDKREACIDKVNYQLQFHLNDSEFMAAYSQASKACYN